MGLMKSAAGIGLGAAGALSGIFALNAVEPALTQSFVPIGGAYPFQGVDILGSIAPTLAGLNPILLGIGAMALGYFAYKMLAANKSAMPMGPAHG